MSEIIPEDRAALNDVGKSHVIIRRVFPGKDNENKRGQPRSYLFVVEEGRILALSQKRPVVPEGVLVKFKKYEPKFKDGEELFFQIKANPVTFETRDGKTKKRPILGDGRTPWLEDELSTRGCEVLAATVASSGVVKGTYRPNRPPLTLNSVLFTGRLRVKDGGRLAKAVMNGIGSGKAYGFGMLMLAR